MAKRLLRYLLYFVIGVAFLAFSVSSIYYAKGYRYNFKAGRLEKTGIILVDTKPDGASLLVDGRGSKDKTPSTVSALLPGVHDLTVEKQGYRTWQKRVSVIPELVTNARYIVLIPDRLTPRRVAGDQSITSLQTSPDGSGFLYLTAAGSELWRMRSDGSGRSRLFTPQAADASLASGSQPVALSLIGWSGDSSRALVRRVQGGQTSYWVINGSSITTLDGLLPTDASSIGFDPRDARQLYFLRDGSLFRLNTVDRTISSPILSQVVMYRAQGDAVLAIRTGDKGLALWQSDPSGGRLERVRDALPPAAYAVAYSPQTDTIALAGPGEIQLFAPSGGRHKLTRVLPGSYGALDWNKTGSRLVYWRADHVGSFDGGFPTDYTVSTQSDVADVRWTSDGAHLVISGSSGLSSFVEFDGAYPLTLKLVSPGSLAYLSGQHELTYLEVSGKLFTLDLERVK